MQQHNGKRVCLLFDKTQRHTTGHYIARAVAKIGCVETALLDADVAIKIDDSRPWGFTPMDPIIEGDPNRAFWAIDTHTAYERVLSIARHFPVVFAAQHDGTERLREDGINAYWVPVAAEPDGMHRDRGVPRDLDVAFVGSLHYEDRREVVRLVEASFDRVVIDNSEDPEKIGELYSRAKVVINHSICNDLNMRIFEALSCGAVLVSSALPDAQLPPDEQWGFPYTTPTEAVDAIENVLGNFERYTFWRARIRQGIIDRHTYAHRLSRMLDILNEQR